MVVKKRKKLGRQIVLRVMSVMTVLFVLFGIIATSVLFTKLSEFAVSSFEMVGTGLQKTFESVELSNLMVQNRESNEALDRLAEEADRFGDNISLVSDRLLIIANYEGEWVYLYGLEGNQVYEFGTPVLEIDEELMRAYTGGQLEGSDLSGRFLLNRQPLDFYFPVTSADDQTLIIHTTIKTDLIWVLIGAIVVAAASLLAMVLITVNVVVGLVVKKEMKAIDLLVKKVEEISNLEGDLTKRIEITSDNELGLMAEHVNSLLDTVHQLLSMIKDTSNHMLESTLAFKNMLKMAEDNTRNIQVSVEESKKAIVNRTASTEEVKMKIAQINASVSQVSERTQDVTEAASKTSIEADQGKTVMREMKQFVHETVAQVSNTGEKVDYLKTQSDAISSIVVSIRAIADQTNLLALNASIEAARAGENGRGFAVVAEEVRKLAEESAQQASSIEHRIQQIQGSIGETQQSMKKTLAIIESENEMVDAVDEKFSHITSSVSKVSEMVQEVYGATEEIHAFSESVNEEMLNLTAYFKESDGSVDLMIKEVVDQNDNVQSLSEKIQSLDSLSRALHEMIDKLTL